MVPDATTGEEVSEQNLEIKGRKKFVEESGILYF
jgi:hypothetical protein